MPQNAAAPSVPDWDAISAQVRAGGAGPTAATAPPSPSSAVNWDAVAAQVRQQGQAPAAPAAPPDPNTVGTLVRHFWNSLTAPGQMLPWPKALGGSGTDNPLLPSNILSQMHDVKQQADAAWDKGDKVTAAAKYVESVVPLLGPWMSHMGDQAQSGQWMALLGDLGGAATSAELVKSGPKALDEAWQHVQAARGARLGSQGLSDFIKAAPPSKSTPYEPATLQRAAPYLSAEQASHPVASVTDAVSAADSAIAQIEEQVHKAVHAFPTDTIGVDPVQAIRDGLAHHAQPGFADQAVQAVLKKYPQLANPDSVTLPEADNVRANMNLVNQGILKLNQYGRAVARAKNPAFAGQEIAANTLRDGIYNRLANDRQVPGIRDLRLDEGALLQVRNALEAKRFGGEQAVTGSGPLGSSKTARFAGRIVLPAMGAAGGEMLGLGYPGAMAGAATGAMTTEALIGDLSRDRLIARAFQRFSKGIPAKGAAVAIPPAPAIRGLLPGAPEPEVPVREGEVVDEPFPDAGTPGGPPIWSSAERPTPAGLLPRGAVPMGAGADTSAVHGEAARGIVVRDPVTGRFKRIYLGMSAGTPQP